MLSVQIDPDNRWEVRDFYNSVYTFGADAQMGWDGNVSTGNPGTLSAGWQEAIRVRINYFRAMAGIDGEIELDGALNAMCQDAALIMSANDALSHSPPDDWLWWTQEGFDAARKSNLALGTSGIESIEGYMADYGNSNYRAGHRRWILYPPSTVMGNGDIPGIPQAGIRSANALWVVPQYATPVPATRDPYVAWPPRGFVPVDFAYARWSFSHPGADFSEATVAMESGGLPMEVRIEPFSQGNSGDPAIVWAANGLATNFRDEWPFPGQDQDVNVQVNDVLVDGTYRNFSYTVTLIDPAASGNGEFPHETTVRGEVYAGVPAIFSASFRPWAEAVQLRVLKGQENFSTHNAERGENTLIASISPGYSPVQTTRKATGSWAFHLANPDSTPQILAIPGQYLITSSNPFLRFDSSLGWASAGQYASVDVNDGGGENWQSIWSKSGPAEFPPALSAVHLDLSPWAGQSIRIRFRYDHDPGTAYYPQVEDDIGWAFDNVVLSGTERVISETVYAPVQTGEPVVAVFESTDSLYLQTRSLAFGGFPLEWGPLTEVSPRERPSVEIPDSQWTSDPMLGWIYGSGAGWAYSPVMGHLDLRQFPWIHTPVGWLRYMRGSMETGLWLYQPGTGFLYTRADFGQTYRTSPFSASEAARFVP